MATLRLYQSATEYHFANTGTPQPLASATKHFSTPVFVIGYRHREAPNTGITGLRHAIMNIWLTFSRRRLWLDH